MGVPVVTLCGDRHGGRVGASILHRAGLAELVAQSGQEYADLVRKLADDRDGLVELRAGLRQRMQDSELLDSRLFTKSLEDTYRGMWLQWLQQRT